jgi:hypothetical protein
MRFLLCLQSLIKVLLHVSHYYASTLHYKDQLAVGMLQFHPIHDSFLDENCLIIFKENKNSIFFLELHHQRILGS